MCQLIAFPGRREDALERLPSLSTNESLELGVDRISLINDSQRVDLYILAELAMPGRQRAAGQPFTDHLSKVASNHPDLAAVQSDSMMLLEICFVHVDQELAKQFLQHLQGSHPVLH